jgi:hypothetical protein
MKQKADFVMAGYPDTFNTADLVDSVAGVHDDFGMLVACSVWLTIEVILLSFSSDDDDLFEMIDCGSVLVSSGASRGLSLDTTSRCVSVVKDFTVVVRVRLLEHCHWE